MDYKSFEVVMDSIACEYVRDYGKFIPVLYSGGLDSTAIVLSLVRNGGTPVLLHIRGSPCMYERGKQLILRNLSERFDLPVVIVSGDTSTAFSFLSVFRELGFTTIVSGDGMDRMYMNCYDESGKSLRFSFGERFRITHPILDVVLNLIPRLRGVYSDKVPVKDDEYSYRESIVGDALGITVLKYSIHPLMTELFEEYKPDIRDVLLRKRFTKQYIGDFKIYFN